MPQASVQHHEYPNGLVLVAESMPSVQSAAFSMLLPAGAAYEPGDLGGSASMLAEWITRGAGDRDSRELLTALDNLGVSHGEGAQTLHTSVSAATLGRNLIPALEIFADVVRRPHLDDEEVEPIRALALQNLQGLEDDPGSKVIYELRRRHFPDPWGRPSPGTPEGVEKATPDDLRAFHRAATSPGGRSWPWPARSIATPSATPSAASSATGSPGPSRRSSSRPVGPAGSTWSRKPSRPRSPWPTPRSRSSPDYYQARALIGVLGGYSSARLFTEVREKRGLCYSVYASYEGQKDRAAVLCYAGTSTDRAQETLDVTLAEIAPARPRRGRGRGARHDAGGLEASLIMQQESSMSRAGSLASDWFYLGRVRPLDEISAALDALTPASVGDFAAAHARTEMTILTLGPTPLELPPED